MLYFKSGLTYHRQNRALLEVPDCIVGGDSDSR